PPRFNTSTPTCDAISLTEETIPLFPRTGGREAAWVEPDELNCVGATVSEPSNAKQSRAERVFLIFMGAFCSGFLMSLFIFPTEWRIACEPHIRRASWRAMIIVRKSPGNQLRETRRLSQRAHSQHVC